MMKADEYATWRRGSLHERLRAVMEISNALYGVKGQAPNVRRLQRSLVVMMKTNDTRSLLFLAGVFLTCMCGLMFQIMETRMLSVIGQYNLAFFAIGVAMLGMTAGALLVFYRFETTYSTSRLSTAMARVMCYFAWSVLGSLAHGKGKGTWYSVC